MPHLHGAKNGLCHFGHIQKKDLLQMELLKALLRILRDFSSTIVFISMIYITQNAVLATSIGVGVGAVQTVWMLLHRKHIRPLQWMSIALVFILGGITIFTGNGFFFKLKSSIMEFGIIAVLLNRKWLMLYLPPVVTENLQERFILRAALAWVALMGVISLSNVIVAYFCSDRVWATFIFTVPAIAYLSLFSVQYFTFRKRILASIRRRARAAAAAATA